MSIEEIIKRMDSIAREKHAKNAMLPDGWPLDPEVVEDEAALREAIALLRTHPDNQPNEPLRWRSCKKEKPEKKGHYEVVCRNGDIPPYVLLGFWDPDHPGWDLYGVTHWRPLPEPPKEE